MYLQAYSENPSTLFLRPVLVLINARREGGKPMHLGLRYRIDSVTAYGSLLPTASHKSGSICPSNYRCYLLVSQWALHRNASDLLSLQGSMPDQGADTSTCQWHCIAGTRLGMCGRVFLEIVGARPSGYHAAVEVSVTWWKTSITIPGMHVSCRQDWRPRAVYISLSTAKYGV